MYHCHSRHSPPPFTTLTSTAFDGYLSGCNVRLAPLDTSLDAAAASPPAAVTDPQGRFTLRTFVDDIQTSIVLGGWSQCVDTATGLTLSTPLATPSGCSALSPLTTLAAVMLRDSTPGDSAAAVFAQLRDTLGLPTSVDLCQLDAVAAARAGRCARTFCSGVVFETLA